MTRFLIYLFPAMMDMVLGATLFVASVRIADSGAGPMAVTGVLTLNSIVYMVVAQIAGRVLTERNAARILIGTSLFMMLVSLAFIVFSGLRIVYFLVVLHAVAMAFFFAPFQVFMKAVEGGREHGIIKSTALYTFSWSAGMALGPFFSGYLWVAAGWQWCYAVNAVLSLLTAIGVVFLKHHAVNNEPDAGPEKRVSERVHAYTRMPDLAWLGWICSGIGCMAWALMRGFFPSTGVNVGISKPDQGVVLALLLGAQAVTGLLFYKSSIWMFQVWPMAALGACGIMGLVLFAVSESTMLFCLGAVLFGIYAGAFFFYFVFHAISHPSRSARYVAVNETVVGFAGIIGPFLAGLIARGFSYTAPYYTAALIVGLALVVQAFIHRRYRADVDGLRNSLSCWPVLESKVNTIRDKG